MATEEFILTGTAVAHAANCTPATVARYARLGLLEHRSASNGTRLYRSDAGPRVREILNGRIANRGGKRR